MSSIPKPPKNASLASHIAYWLSVGFGSGLSPKAPGTTGSLAALIFLPLWISLGFWVSLALIIFASLVGIWICGRAARDMGIHDSGHIVWDEWAGQWLALLPLIWAYEKSLGSAEALTTINLLFYALIGFILFRFFDILKPWPIRIIDKKVDGGFGIMLDDVLAGTFAAIWLHIFIVFML